VVGQCANRNAATNFNECGRDENGQCYNGACKSLDLKCEKHFKRNGVFVCLSVYVKDNSGTR